MSAALVEQAIALLQGNRWPMVPCSDRNPEPKAPCVKWKHHQTELPNVEQLWDWERKFRPERWGPVTGSLAGIVVADFDGEMGRNLMESWGIIPHVRTGSGGAHLYVRHPGWNVPTLNSRSAKDCWPWTGLDIRGDGGFAVLLGRNSNGPYIQLRELVPDPWETLPAEVRDFLRNHGGGQQHAEHKVNGHPDHHHHPYDRDEHHRVDAERLIRMALDTVGSNGRNNAGLWLACQLRDNGYSMAEAESALSNFRSRCPSTNAKGEREAYTEHEMQASLKEAYSRPPREPWTPRNGHHPTTATNPPADSSPDVNECFAEAEANLNPHRTIREWRDRLILTKGRGGEPGGPRPLLANAITALRYCPEWSDVLGFNEFSLGTVALKPTPWGSVSEWTDHEDRLVADWLQHQGIYVSVETAGQAVQTVSKDRSFHPVREYMQSLKWDGTSRIDDWVCLHLGSEPTDFARAAGARWLISAVARVMNPGAKADCCLILEGEQGLKKSTALKILAQPWFTDEIAELGSKDAALQTRGVWVIEIAELDSMARAEVSKIKAFMSRTTDRFRPPYGKRLIESPRQCVFAGSVNRSDYLRDETGGRRFWPISCGRILTANLERDRDQLWAEALVRYRAGSVWWLDTPELNRQAETVQADRYEGDAWDPLILEWAAERTAKGCDSVSVGEFLEMCLEKKKADWTRADEMRVGRCLRAAKWERYRDRKRGMEWRYRPQIEPKAPPVPTSSGNIGGSGNSVND